MITGPTSTTYTTLPTTTSSSVGTTSVSPCEYEVYENPPVRYTITSSSNDDEAVNGMKDSGSIWSATVEDRDDDGEVKVTFTIVVPDLVITSFSFEVANTDEVNLAFILHGDQGTEHSVPQSVCT